LIHAATGLYGAAVCFGVPDDGGPNAAPDEDCWRPPAKKWSVAMKRVWSFLLGVVCGAALLHVASNYHVVRSSEGFAIVAKTPPRLSESFVDIRSFSAGDWSGHAQLASALVQAQQSVNQLLPDGMR
jgi:hypothetical protein